MSFSPGDLVTLKNIPRWYLEMGADPNGIYKIGNPKFTWDPEISIPIAVLSEYSNSFYMFPAEDVTLVYESY